MARADEHLVKVYLRDQLIKTHPRRQPGGRSTDAADMPPGVEGYATRTVDRLVAQAACYGESHRDLRAAAAGRRRAVDDDAVGLPADRAGQALRRRGGRGGLRAGPGRRCHQRLQDRVDAQERHREHPGGSCPAAAGGGRFARDAAEYATATGIRLQVVDGGNDPAGAAGPDLPHRPCRPPESTLPAPSAAGCKRPIPSGFLFIPFLLPSGKEKERPLP